MSSPTQRSLALLRKQGYEVQVVEKWIPQAKKRVDLFGVIDIVFLGMGHIVGVQTTTGSNLSTRIKKCLASDKLKRWLRNGGKFILHGWSKMGAKGKRKTWKCREVHISVEGEILTAFELPC